MTSRRVTICLTSVLLLGGLLVLGRFLCSLRLRVINEGDVPIRNVVLQGRGIGQVIYRIPARKSRVVLVQPALETDVRFEFSSGATTYRGLLDEYLTRGCSGWIDLVLDPRSGHYRWRGRLRRFCFGPALYITNSASCVGVDPLPPDQVRPSVRK